MSKIQRTVKLLILTLSLMLSYSVMPILARLKPAIDGKAVSTVQKHVGAIPAQHLSGKIDEVLFDSQWRFQVLSVQTLDSYAMKTDAEPYGYVDVSSFNTTKRTFIPKSGYKLIVIECHAANAQKSQERLWVSASDTSNVRTALTDTGGSSHVPIAYDFEGGPIQTKPLRSGETVTFPIIFSVPEKAEPKELIFTLAANGERETSKDAHVLLSVANSDENKKMSSTPDPSDFRTMVDGFINFTEYRLRFVQP